MSDRKSAVVPAVVAAVAVIALLAMVLAPMLSAEEPAGDDGSGTEAGHDATGRAPDETWEQLVRREADDPMARGAVDAPVVMVAYSEFQCPFCGKFARDTEPVLVEKYVEDGTLRIEWRDFPYLGPESTTAAHAGRAAAAQGEFWAFQEAMYADQLPPNSGRLDQDHLNQVARDVGLDLDAFEEDMDSAAVRQAVAADFEEGQAIGVTGTPAFVINGVPVIGAQPTHVFEETIEQAAEEASAP